MPFVLVRINLIIGATAAVVALIGVVWLGVSPGEEEDVELTATRAAATAFTAGWAGGDAAAAAAATDDAPAATAALQELIDRLSVSAAVIGEPEVTLDEAGTAGTAAFTVQLTLRGLGDWAYETTAGLARTETGTWHVVWAPAVLHPSLRDGTRLGRIREQPERAPILDRHGEPIVTERPVRIFGVWREQMTDPDAAYAAIDDALDVDVAALRERVESVPANQFVEIVTLRADDASGAVAAFDDVAGVIVRNDTWPLAPTRDFARAVLGTVAPATEETLENAGPLASSVDLLGASGLQYAHQQRLAGVPGGQIVLVDRESGDQLSVVHTFEAQPGEPRATTLDVQVQMAADAALASVEQPSALVAVQPSTGAILAAANGPEGEGLNRAFTGQYPPGSTFKVVTTTALLTGGLDPAEPVECPETVTVEGKTFKNADGIGALGSVPFRTAFAQSCNTAFIGLRDRLNADSLTEAAAMFGIGGEWNVGWSAYTGSVPAAASEVEKAADMIGQGKVLVSPLVMASIAATVQSGSFTQPYLVEDPSAARFTASASLPAEVAAQLRDLMRAVVLEGSGSALRNLPGEPAAKTGTAEFGDDDPPRTHAWMIGFRGDLAFAVLIEDGGGGGANAGPVAARFLSAIG